VTSQDVAEACRKAISSVLQEKQSEDAGHDSSALRVLTPDKVSAACKRALEAISKNPAASTSKGVRQTTEGEPVSARRIQLAVQKALESVCTRPLQSSPKGVKHTSYDDLETPPKKKNLPAKHKISYNQSKDSFKK